MTEHAIQSSIVQYLERFLPKSIRVVGVSNNPRSAIQGALEKKRGMKAGFPDLMLVGSFYGHLEVKAKGGTLSPAQKEWASWFLDNDIPYAVVRSIDDAHKVMVEWGLL